jgi:hypothetical protein
MGHTRPHPPQFAESVLRLASHPFTALLSQLAKPAAHAIPHTPPAQVGVEFGSVGHGMHAAPQVATSLFETHADPQRWKPVRQAKPHDVPLHVAIAFGGAEHAVQELPHVAGLMLLAQLPPQA